MKQETKPKKKRSVNHELIEWGAILGVVGVLYFSGLHVPVIGNLQRVLLWTGLMSPDTEQKNDSFRKANYNIPLITLDGNDFELEEFKGKTIFLNFWATWCP